MDIRIATLLKVVINITNQYYKTNELIINFQ